MIEGGLAQAGQHMIERMLEELDLLPGFREGMQNVSTDEQRHIAFGVRLLADLYEENPGPIQDAIIGTFREVLPMSTCVAQIPGWDLSYTRSLGYDLEDLYEEGARMQEARLRAIGLPLDDIPNFPLPLDVPPRERGERGIKLMKAQYLGPKDGVFTPDDEATEILFDQMAPPGRPRPRPGRARSSSGTSPTPSRGTSSSTTASTRVARGRAPAPDLVLRSTFEDWVDVTSGRADPARLLLRRRLRAKGRLRLMARMPKIFA